MSRREWPIIVGGCHRSGTSLVRRLLNAHSRIFCGPEVKFFRDFFSDYRDDPLRHLRFTQSARAIIEECDLLQILGGAYVRLQGCAAARAEKARWADKNPENVLYLEAWQKLLCDEWLFVHVVRNPLDTLASMSEAKFPLSLPHDLEGKIEHYKIYTQRGLDFAAKTPERYHRIVYEELVAQPKATLERLMKWLGEKAECQQLAFNQLTHQSGLEDRKVAATERVHQGSIGRWSAVLNETQAARILAATDAIWSQLCPAGQSRAS